MFDHGGGGGGGVSAQECFDDGDVFLLGYLVAGLALRGDVARAPEARVVLPMRFYQRGVARGADDA